MAEVSELPDQVTMEGRSNRASPSQFALGASVRDDDCSFLVWAPHAREMKLQIDGPDKGQIQMNPVQKGYFQCCTAALRSGATYFYLLDGKNRRPDPASRYQPYGVHGPSQVFESKFKWTDSAWRGLPLDAAIIYELHVGTFTPAGTFEAIIERLQALKSLGVTMFELMPVAQFPGERNWGYDGVFPYAVQNSYGGPTGLKTLVDACHQLGMAVVLDVVYNHLGPEGNYLSDFGPYFTECYKTPWGEAVNFDGRQSDEVRRFFIENALYWIREFHMDGLRLDAVHAIIDVSARRFLEDLTDGVRQLSSQLGRKVHIIAENDRNDSRSLEPLNLGGFGFDSQWNDDFHHSVHALVTGERHGYYQDFGGIRHLAKASSEGFVYSGQYSKFRQRSHGSSSAQTPNHQFVVFSQNHDQVGNRAQGERLSQLVDFELQKLVAGIVLLSPFIPLLFMGEEYGETAPFQYFVSHEDANLTKKVQEGRRREFADFAQSETVQDPADPETFLRSKLHWDMRDSGHHSILLAFYKELIRLRKTVPALCNLNKADAKVIVVEPSVLIIERKHNSNKAGLFFNFGRASVRVANPLDGINSQKRIDSRDEKWGGPGSSTPQSIDPVADVSFELGSHSFVLF